MYYPISFCLDVSGISTLILLSAVRYVSNDFDMLSRGLIVGLVVCLDVGYLYGVSID